MDDFEGPSFSLGFEETQELIPEGSFGEAILNVPEKKFCVEDQNVSNATDSASGNAGNTGADADFESPPRTTARILKRLKRGPSQTCASSSVFQHEEKPAKIARESKISALQSFWQSLNHRKTSSLQVVVDGEDDIEEYSSDDDFEPQELCSQSARKLSLFGSSALSRSAEMQRASSKFDQRDTADFQGQATQGKSSNEFRDFQERFGGDVSRSSDKPKNFRTISNGTSAMSIDRSDNTTFPVRSLEFQAKQSPNLYTTLLNQFGGSETSQVEYRANNARLNALLRRRFPHFVPVNALHDGEQTSSERVYIDYVNQFTAGGNASAPFESAIPRKERKSTQVCPRTTTKRTQATRKRRRNIVVDNDGWVQPCRTPVNAQRTEGQSGTGRWVTEKSGKRIYITRDGTKLSGQSAYRQHCKEKKSYKTKKRRPRNKK